MRRRFTGTTEWEDGGMKGTDGAFLRRPLIIATLVLSLAATTVTTVGATSVTTTTMSSAAKYCGVVANPSVRVVTKGSPCVIDLRLGAHVRIKFRSGFRWGYPVSDSRAVAVTAISRDSIGVVAVTLHAAALGQALLRTTGTIYCKPGRACPDLALLWSLKVIVTKSVAT
jgi:hypothetical protein